MSDYKTYTREEYIAAFKDIAIDQQVKYGIPASVTLAQGILESGHGNSNLCREGKNHFGIKLSKDEEKNKHPFVWGLDNGKNCKFKAFGSDLESFQAHSKLLMNSNYSQYCGKLSPTDYQHWVEGLVKGHYAEDPNYVNKVVGLINQYNLQQYDQQAMQVAQQQGKMCGFMRGKADDGKMLTGEDTRIKLPYLFGNFAMPIDLSKVYVSSEFNNHTGSHATHFHKGIDLSTNGKKGVPVVATEDNGKIVKKATEDGAGNYVVVEYHRPNQPAIQCTYMHLDSFADVKEGDVVKAGDKLGEAGRSGHSTGIHLHFEVNVANDKGEFTKEGRIDPKLYLAELQVRSGQDVVLRDKDKKSDYLADTRAGLVIDDMKGNLAQRTGSNDPNKWLQLLQMQNNDYTQGMDGLTSILSGYFTSMMLCLMRIKGNEAAREVEKELKAVEQKQQQQPTDNTVHLSRESVDGKALKQSSSAFYEDSMRNAEGQAQIQNQSRGYV